MTEDSDALDRKIADILQPHLVDGGPGVIVGITRDNVTLVRRAFGFAHVELGLPLTCETLMPIASITKHMAAMCALLLAEAGLIDIDAPIGRYLPELPRLQGVPTLRQLMTHQSGLRCHYDVGLLSAMAVRPDGDAMATMVGLTSVNAAPGAWMVYGNSGYHLLSLAIERAVGKPFEVVMSDWLFAPMGMVNSRFFRSIHALRSGVASLYLADGSGSWINTSHVRTESLGEGGACSTIDDMLRWARALRREDAPFAAALWQELKDPAALADGSIANYALGLQVGTWRGIATVGHGGGLVGSTSYMVNAPDHAIDIVVLANSGLPIEQIARQIMAAIVGEHALEPVALPPRIDEYAGLAKGLFVSEHFTLSFGDVNAVVAASFMGLPLVPLEAGDIGAQSLQVNGATGPILITLPDGLAGDRVIVTMGGDTHECFRRAHQVPSIDDLTPALGSYVSAEGLGRIDLRREDDTLIATGQNRLGASAFVVTALTHDILNFTDTLIGAGFQARIDRDGDNVIGLQLSTTRTRHLAFARIAS